MNKNLVCLFAVALLAGCSTDKNAYTITGTVDDESVEGKMVYLGEYENNEQLDSAVVTNGMFVLKGTAAKTTIARLNLGRNYYTNFILEGGNITVDFNTPNIAHGTPLNDIFSDFTLKYDALTQPFNASIRALREDAELDDETRNALAEEKYEVYVNQLNDLYSSMFTPNKDNMVGAFLLWQWSYNLSVDEMDSLYAIAGDDVKNFGVILKIMATNEKIRKTQAGMPFVDFTIEDGNADGSAVSFSDYIGKGKYVLVDFWASWCGPCIAEIPVLMDVHNKHNGDKFQILGVAVWDERDATVEAIAKHKTPWSQIINAQTIPTDLYGISGIPQIILFGPDGTIVARDLRGDALKKKVEEVLAL